MAEGWVVRDGVLILYDAEQVEAPGPEWLQSATWAATGNVQAELGGRGQALSILTPAGPAVLRRFRRGGLVAALLEDRYLRLGARHSRAVREFRVLARLRAHGLPVPTPLVASYEPAGPFYRAGLITRLIPAARQLAEIASELAAKDWLQLAETLSDFFDAGLIHPDLNARNILRDAEGRWFVVDLDRAQIKDRPVSGRPMLARLGRSLNKLGVADWQSGFERCRRKLR